MSDTIRKPVIEMPQKGEIPESAESGERVLVERPSPIEQKNESDLSVPLPPPPSDDDDSQLHLVEENKSPLLKDIERVLEEDLELLYSSLNHQQRKQFRQEGEKTAAKIEKMMHKAKVTVIEIIKLIKKWLSLLPGANKYFLEKEAKIKSEKIFELKKVEEDW